MTRKGFSMMETLVVLSIIVVLLAIMSPAILGAVKATRITQSTLRMRQLHEAVLLYQQDYGTDGPFSNSLPPYSLVYSRYLGLGESFFVSPCGYKEGIESNQKHLSYQYWNLQIDPGVREYYQKYGTNAMLFSDPHCNDSAQQWRSVFKSKRGIGVTYAGTLINQFKPGDPTDPAWWSTPEGE